MLSQRQIEQAYSSRESLISALESLKDVNLYDMSDEERQLTLDAKDAELQKDWEELSFFGKQQYKSVWGSSPNCYNNPNVPSQQSNDNVPIPVVILLWSLLGAAIYFIPYVLLWIVAIAAVGFAGYLAVVIIGIGVYCFPRVLCAIAAIAIIFGFYFIFK